MCTLEYLDLKFHYKMLILKEEPVRAQWVSTFHLYLEPLMNNKSSDWYIGNPVFGMSK